MASRGAKDKCKDWLTPDGLQRLESWARDGLTDEQIAANIGVSKSTFYKWKREHAQFSDAIKKGKAPVDFEVENALLKRALGYEVTEDETIFKVSGTKTDENGKMVPILDYNGAKVIRRKRHIPPDPLSIFYWLKNRKPEQWRDKREYVGGGGIDKPDAYDALSKSLRELAEGLRSDKP